MHQWWKQSEVTVLQSHYTAFWKTAQHFWIVVLSEMCIDPQGHRRGTLWTPPPQKKKQMAAINSQKYRKTKASLSNEMLKNLCCSTVPEAMLHYILMTFEFFMIMISFASQVSHFMGAFFHDFCKFASWRLKAYTDWPSSYINEVQTSRSRNITTNHANFEYT